ncbi:hypothetical protein PLESTB_000693400 [Pleodorina starrii]|uniref:RRM domain-containing protein n=1 Tax=Pleodorina starrii TaxID=330485 RepID=A0A9W6F1N1_9CHLO|nr:hypothetical protein PLESTM_001223700 [Pleodorina starrii]GLC52964.1 hypothetical protein PLESTB_000693400 [Pleodorina starrii]GLC65260.1 hypothetical protein PLESTF_000269700 [Pleodorina starrii]
MVPGCLSASWRHSGTDLFAMQGTALGVQGHGGVGVHSHTLSSETLASMYEQSTDRSRGVASEAGSLQQPSGMLKNASDPSLRSTGSSFADLESAGYTRHGFHRQEDLDIFSAVGGMDLGGDADLESPGGEVASTSVPDPHSEPSRTIFVRHINPAAGDEELLGMFKVFGDVRHINTISKHRGFVVVTYFDLRAALRAQVSLHGVPMAGMPLEVHYCVPKGDPAVNQGTVTVFNLDPDTSNDHLVWLFSKFGDVKDIRESPDRSNQKFITYYDTRHALAALRAMNKAEHLGKLPANVTPQLAASVSQLTMQDASAAAGMEGAAPRVSLAGGVQPGSAGGTWDPQHAHSAEALLQAQLAAAKRAAASRASSQPGTSSPSPLLGTSPAGQAFMAQARHEAQVPPSVVPKFQHQQQGQGQGQAPQGLASGQQQQQGQQQGHHSAEYLSSSSGSGARPGLHVSDSASSMSSVAGQAASQLFAAAQAAAGRSPLGGAAGAAMMGGPHGHIQKAVPSLATLSEAQALEEQANLYAAAAAGSMMAGAGGGAGAGQVGLEQAGGGAAGVNAAATANMLIGLQQQLGQEQQLWALQQQMAAGAAAQGQAGLWAAAAAAAGSLYGPQQQQAAAAAANLQTLRNLQELQARQQAVAAAAAQQQQQQQQQAAMAANLALLQGQATLSAADLNAAAAHLLHIAGLGNALGPSPVAAAAAAAAASYLPAAAAAGLGVGGGGLAGLVGSAGSLSGLGGAAQAQAQAQAAAAQQLLQNAMAMGNVGALNALGSMQAALGGQSGARLGGSFGSQSGALAGGSGAGGHHGGRDGGGGGGSRGGGRLSRRTTDPAAELERKMQQEKLYALDPVKIRSGEDKRTTLMVKNIPNKYTQKMLLATIDEQFKGTYDFFYLPIDFKNKCNVGYAFINMINPFDIIGLVERFNNRRWERFNSEKVCNISYARIQGRAALVAHFQNSSLMHEDKRCRPILFTANGTETTDPEAFQNDPSLQPVPSGCSTASSSAASLHASASGGAVGGAGGAANAAAAAAAAAAGIGPARLRAAAAAAAAASAAGGAAVAPSGGGGGNSAEPGQGGGSVGPPGSSKSAGG